MPQGSVQYHFARAIPTTCIPYIIIFAKSWYTQKVADKRMICIVEIMGMQLTLIETIVIFKHSFIWYVN